jgi:hypothetical protein
MFAVHTKYPEGFPLNSRLGDKRNRLNKLLRDTKEVERKIGKIGINETQTRSKFNPKHSEDPIRKL